MSVNKLVSGGVEQVHIIKLLLRFFCQSLGCIF